MKVKFQEENILVRLPYLFLVREIAKLIVVGIDDDETINTQIISHSGWTSDMFDQVTEEIQEKDAIDDLDIMCSNMEEVDVVLKRAKKTLPELNNTYPAFIKPQ